VVESARAVLLARLKPCHAGIPQLVGPSGIFLPACGGGEEKNGQGGAGVQAAPCLKVRFGTP